MKTNTPPRTSLVAAFALSAFSLAVFLLLAELGLRLVGWERPLPYIYDQDLGNAHRPNTEGPVFEEGGLIDVRINSLGLMGAETTREKPQNTYRIAVLGDSFAEGIMIEEPKRFHLVLQNRLSKCAALQNKNVEAINFAVSGQGTAQALIRYRRDVVGFDPDVVLLLFHEGNDFRNNIAELQGAPFRPYLKPADKSEGFELDMSFQQNPDFIQKLKWANPRGNLVNRVRLLQMVFFAYDNWTRRQLLNAGQSGAAEVQSEPTVAEWIEPVEPLHLLSQRLTEAAITQLGKEVLGHGDRFLLTQTVMQHAVDPNPSVRQKYDQIQRNPEGGDYVANRFAALAKAHGFWHKKLRPALVKRAEIDNTELHKFEATQTNWGHWNAIAHQVVGETLAEEICHNLSSGN